MNGSAAPADVDAYVATFPPRVRGLLARIRRTIRRAAPEAREGISYRMPAFRMAGVLLYVAAFQAHIGIYPPISGDPRLEKALARYAGPKGNLRFPLDEPFPFDLLERIVRLRVRQDRAQAAARRG